MAASRAQVDSAVEVGAGLGVALRVDREGLQRVGFEDLLAAGVDWTGVSSRSLAVVDSNGASVPVQVNAGSRFAPGGFVEFWGEPVDTLYTDTNVYRLVVDRSLRVDMPVDRSRVPKQSVPADETHVATVSASDNLVHSPLAPGDDPWYWTRILAFGSPHSFVAPIDVAEVGDGAVNVAVDVWGGIDLPDGPDHHVVISVNGVDVADTVFDGIIAQRIEASVPAGILVAGENLVEVTVVGDGPGMFDWVNLEAVTITYPTPIAATNGALVFDAGSRRVAVDGLHTDQFDVYRFETGDSNPGNITRVIKSDVIHQPDGSITATFAGTGDNARYAVIESSAVLIPQIAAARAPAGLLDGDADLVIITHPMFTQGLDPLIDARQQQGLTVKIVEVEDLYAAYTGEIVDAAAIDNYIADAATAFNNPAVLLVGADSYDYRDYTATGSIAFIPTQYGNVGVGGINWAPLDPLYADTDNDQIPDLALGRFPVHNLDELANTINKTLAYTPNQNTMMAADIDYGSEADTLSSHLPADQQVTTAYLDEQPVTQARTNLIDAINNGAGLVTYFGHSSTGQWSSEALLTTSDVASFTNTDDPNLVVQFGCWNTYFSDPTQQSLGTALITDTAGAASVVGAVTLTNETSDIIFGPHMISALHTQHTIGDALLTAKQNLNTTTTAPDITLGWTLLGDPTLSID